MRLIGCSPHHVNGVFRITYIHFTVTYHSLIMKIYQQPITEIHVSLDTECQILLSSGDRLIDPIGGGTSADYIHTMPVSGDYLSDPSFNVRNISGAANWD